MSKTYLAYLAIFRDYGRIVPVGDCCLPNCLIASSLPFLIAKLPDAFERRLPLPGKWAAKILAFFGASSLEFYCVQEWFADMMIPDLSKRGWPAFAINSAIFLMITAISWAASRVFKYFWKLAELPFERKKAAKNDPEEART